MSIFKLFEKEIKEVETTIKSDLASVFAQAKSDAAKANSYVDDLKSKLALAIKEAAELSQKAAEAARDAAQEAEIALTSLKAEAVKHASVAAAQANQIVVAPAPISAPINTPPAPVLAAPTPEIVAPIPVPIPQTPPVQ